jgi:hypothetical protein
MGVRVASGYGIEVEIDGIPEQVERLRAMETAVQHAMVAAAKDVALEGERMVHTLLALLAHPPRTVTPSRPGEPPAMISGALSEHVRRTSGFFNTMSNSVDVEIRSTKSGYARIQERGGWAGARDRRVYLPPRPYMAPVHARLKVMAPVTFRHHVARAVEAFK